MRILLFIIVLISAGLGFAASFDRENAEINRLLSGTEEIRYNYCIDRTLTCRSLVALVKKGTSIPVNMIYNSFFSAERRVAITGYFLKNRNGSFRAYSDSTFDGKINIDTVNEWDKRIRVTFDSDGFPTLHDLYLRTLGTTKYSIATLSYSKNRSMVKGTTYDSANPNFSEPVQIIYNRVR